MHSQSRFLYVRCHCNNIPGETLSKRISKQTFVYCDQQYRSSLTQVRYKGRLSWSCLLPSLLYGSVIRITEDRYKLLTKIAQVYGK